MADEYKKYREDPEYNGFKDDGTPLKLLIVDDSLAIRKVIRRIAEGVGYEVVAEASNGKEAELMYTKFLPDIVTMDITMPDVEGDEALEMIIRNDPDARIVMLTSIGHKEAVKNAIIKGAKGYIVKPIIGDQIPKLLKTLKRAAKK